MYKINEKIDEIFDELKELSEYIYNNPELGNQEFLSSKAHIDFLTKYGFEVEEHFIGIETAFKAQLHYWMNMMLFQELDMVVATI